MFYLWPIVKSDHWNVVAHTHSFSACEGQLYLLKGVTLKFSYLLYITSHKSRFSVVCIWTNSKCQLDFFLFGNNQNTATGYRTLKKYTQLISPFLCVTSTKLKVMLCSQVQKYTGKNTVTLNSKLYQRRVDEMFLKEVSCSPKLRLVESKIQ